MIAAVASPMHFADVLLGGSPRDARTEAIAAIEGGLPPRSLYVDVLGPALVEVGVRWQHGLATVAQEHLATASVSTIMATMAATLEESPAVERSAVLACSEGEIHTVGLRMVADFLEADGWEVAYLGPMTPSLELIGLVRAAAPDLVGLTTALTTHLAAAAKTIAELHTLPRRPLVIVGGQAYADDASMAEHVGADLFALDAGVASRMLRARFAIAPS